MVKFQLVSSLLFLSTSCATVAQFNYLVGTSVKLNKSSAKSIAGKISGELYLKGVCLNKYMDDPLVTKIIREELVNFELLSKQEANFVEPEHLLLTGSNKYKLKVFDGASTAWSKTITLIVESNSDITPWTTDDHDFHFIAYFTPGDYLWLKKILMHDPKLSKNNWFLGCFIQVLNDNDFDSDCPNIPWTNSLKKIFVWADRLQEHMGHFGFWGANKSYTADAMINRSWGIPICQNIDNLMHNLRTFFYHQTAENNFGMMVNLAWHYDSYDNPMILRSAYVW